MKPSTFPHRVLIAGALAAIVALAACNRPTLLAAPPASAPAATTAAAIASRYQLALDQLSQNHLIETRAILEDGIRRYGNAPDLVLLLGYVAGRQGRADEARRYWNSIAQNSPVAIALAAQAGTSAPGSAAESERAGNSRDSYTYDAPPEKAVPLHVDASLPQSDARLEKLELAMAKMVNAEREKLGLQALTYDAKLAGAARAHSAEMRDRKYFAHESPTVSLHEPLDRYQAAFKETPMVVAENIYRAWGSQHELGDEDIQTAHAALMKSPGHRANIVYPDVKRIGIGIVANPTGDIWVTQMFSKSV